MMAWGPCMQWLTVPTPRRPLCEVSRTSSARPPFRPQPGLGEMLPHRRARGGDVELDHGCRGLAGHFVHLPVVFLLPCLFEVAHPALHLADDVDRLPVLDQALRRRIDAHGPDAGVGIQRVGVAAEALVDAVLQQAVNEDDVAAGEFLAARHLLLDELAVVADELEVEILHLAAGVALAGGRLLDVAKPLPEGEIGRLDGVLEHRAVDLVGDRVEEGRVALELGEPERRPQPPHHRVHHVGDDVLRVVELDAGEKAGVAGDVGDHETGGFGFRKHRAVPSS